MALYLKGSPPIPITAKMVSYLHQHPGAHNLHSPLPFLSHTKTPSHRLSNRSLSFPRPDLGIPLGIPVVLPFHITTILFEHFPPRSRDHPEDQVIGSNTRQALKQKQLALTFTTVINTLPQNIDSFLEVPFSVSNLAP